jgi:hypothetical protein
MAYTYPTLKGIIQLAADLLADLGTKVALGSTTGDPVLMPAAAKKGRRSWARGTLWLSGTSPPDVVLQEIGAHLDKFWAPWAEISTSGAGVAPAITTQEGIASATKSEILDMLYINFSPEFLSANYVAHASLGVVPSCAAYYRFSKSQLGVRFSDPGTGAIININNQTVLVSATGRV